MKIYIANAHWYNRGDEAALMVYVNHLAEQGHEITVEIKDRQPGEIFTLRGVRINSISTKYLPKDTETWERSVMTDGREFVDEEEKKALDAMRGSDLIIYSPGGSVICDRFWWVKQLEYLTPFLYAKTFNIPMFVASPSMGPYNNEDEEHIEIRKDLFKVPKHFFVREPISKEYLSAIGINDNIKVSIDSAFYDSFDKDINENLFKADTALADFMGNDCKTVAMTVTDLQWNIGYREQKEELKTKTRGVIRGVIAYLNQKGYSVLLIPQLFGLQNDEDLLKEFRSGNKVFVLDTKYNCHFQQYIISRCYAVIGMRYHSNIFAAKVGIPFIPICYEEKMKGFLKMYDLDDWGIMMEQFSVDNIISKFERLEKEYSDYQTVLSTKIPVWRSKAAITIETLDDMICAIQNRR